MPTRTKPAAWPRPVAEQATTKSLASFNKAIELEPKSPTALTHRGRIRAMKGDIPGPWPTSKQAMKLQPGSVQALLLHANLLASQRQVRAGPRPS